MPPTDLPEVLSDFEAGRIDPAQFPHREHVRVSYELLQRHPFPEALLHLARGLRRLAAKAGHPEAYHETITAAFLALIAERRLAGAYSGVGGLHGAQSRFVAEGIAFGILRARGAAIAGSAPDVCFAKAS